MKCPICKKELDANLSSCPFCGTPIEEKDGDYVKGTFSILEYSKKKSKDKAHDQYVAKSRTIAGICCLVSFPLMLGALIFMIFTFITFNPGTPNEVLGITYVPYSICFLLPSFLCAIIAFFKSKDIGFKSANRIATIEVIVNGVLTIFGFIILMLITTGNM